MAFYIKYDHDHDHDLDHVTFTFTFKLLSNIISRIIAPENIFSTENPQIMVINRENTIIYGILRSK